MFIVTNSSKEEPFSLKSIEYAFYGSVNRSIRLIGLEKDLQPLELRINKAIANFKQENPETPITYTILVNSKTQADLKAHLTICVNDAHTIPEEVEGSPVVVLMDSYTASGKNSAIQNLEETNWQMLKEVVKSLDEANLLTPRGKELMILRDGWRQQL